MFSIYLFKKLHSVKHSTAIPSLLRDFEKYYEAHVSCFSTSLVNVGLSTKTSPNLFTSFGNHYHLNVSCYSTSSLVNVNDLTKNVRKSNKKSVKEIDEEKSFTVSYLMNSFGVSREKAILVSAKTHFDSLEKPNSVFALFKRYGFSDTQIAVVVRKNPRILVIKEKSILPKLDFFLSIGMSKDFLATFISVHPRWLLRSLNSLIIPNYNFLKSFFLTDEEVISVMRRKRIFSDPVAAKRLAPNIKILRELRVPESCIRLFLGHRPEGLTVRSDVFKVNVSKLLEMGFDPFKSTFVMAINVVSTAAWDRCYETYSSWGLSKEDIYTAFRKHPNCMTLSENNISRTMDYLVNKIGLNAKLIAQHPQLIFLSLERRIIPRFSVIQLLLSKGLIVHYSLNTVLSPAEKYFLNKFVAPYEEEIPELNDFYKGKVGVME